MDKTEILNALGQMKDDLENKDVDARDIKDILLKVIRLLIKTIPNG